MTDVDEIELLGHPISQGEVSPDLERMKPLSQVPPPKKRKSQDVLVLLAVNIIAPNKTNAFRGKRSFPLAATCKIRLYNLKNSSVL